LDIIKKWSTLMILNATVPGWQKMSKDQLAIIFGASGCGKTRAIFESLSKKIGLYFTTSFSHSACGSTDLRFALQNLLSDRITSDKESNKRIAQHLFLSLILARLWLLNHLVKQLLLSSPCPPLTLINGSSYKLYLVISLEQTSLLASLRYSSSFSKAKRNWRWMTSCYRSELRQRWFGPISTSSWRIFLSF